LGRFGVIQGHRQCHHSIERIRLSIQLKKTVCLSCTVFTARCYAFAVLAVGLCPSISVCLSVTSRCTTKTAKRRITQTTPHDSSVAKDLREIRQRSHPTRAPNAGWVVKIGDFRQITGYILKTVNDRHIVSIKVE